MQVGDPVGSGFVASLARPGSNVTGFMHFEPAQGGKWLEVLKEITPAMTRALVLLLPEATANVEFVRAAQAAGPIYKVAVSSAGVHNGGDIERAVTTFAADPNSGLIVLPYPISGTHSPLIAELGIRHRLPTIGAFRDIATSGGLVLRHRRPGGLSTRGGVYRSYPKRAKSRPICRFKGRPSTSW